LGGIPATKRFPLLGESCITVVRDKLRLFAGGQIIAKKRPQEYIDDTGYTCLEYSKMYRQSREGKKNKQQMNLIEEIMN
jgi:hypothetical protein